MNSVALVGFMTKKPELKTTSSNIPVTRFNLAIRRTKDETDFINCIAWRNTAELICKYFDKGSQIGINGKIQTRSYQDKDGRKAYTTDVVVDTITFINKKEIKEEKEETINEDIFASFGEKVEEDSFLD